MNEPRRVKFFDITGKTLVHPISYQMQEFQKQILCSAVTRNTAISLPSGLGMPYLSSILIFNFQRWFLNGKVVILSQTKNYIVEQINACNSFTTLNEEYCSDLYGNATSENEAAWNKPIIFTSPMKFLSNIQNNIYNINNIVLLIVYESNKVAKCQEYETIMNLLSGIEFRVVVFLDGSGFSVKLVKQIIEIFNVSQLEFRKLCSPDIKDCTFCSEIESVALDISPHMISIKDAFYAVYEKYGKLLKDARIMNGNIASFTKHQIQKAKEKFMKTSPENMTIKARQELLDSMTMCSFLCTGIDILHNWGIRSFYNYLFDEDKDGELKVLIVKDEHLKNQMKLLNEYLKSNGKRIESLMSRIIHPKLLYLKNLIIRHFSATEKATENIRIVVFCSMEEIVDEINRMLSSLPDYVRHHCVKTKAKSLGNTNEYKEVVENFNNGVINVLVLSNLVEEVIKLETDLIISLEPSKALLKFSDPRFHKGADKCFFILTKGSEYQKFESLLNDRKNEQKSFDMPEMDQIFKDSPYIFPDDFNPEFESTSVTSKVSISVPSAGQKTMLNYLKSNRVKKLDRTDNNDLTDRSIFAADNCCVEKISSPLRTTSPFLFEDTVTKTETEADIDLDEYLDSAVLRISPEAVSYAEQLESCVKNDDSFDELLLDFAIEKPKVSVQRQLSTSQSSVKENVFSKTNDLNHTCLKLQPQKSSITSNRSTFSDMRKTHACPLLPSPEIKSRSPSILENNSVFNEINSTTLQREMLKDFSFSGDSKRRQQTIEKTFSKSENTLPILTCKKSNKKLSRSLFPVKDCSESIHFDSTFEFDENFKIDLCDNNKEEKAPASVDNWDPDCELFEDDTFDDIAANLITPIKEPMIMNTSTPVTNKSEELSTTAVQMINVREESAIETSSSNNKKSQLLALPKPIESIKADDCDINFSIDLKKYSISKSFFSKFSSSIKEKFKNSYPNPKHSIRNDDDSDDEFPWLKTSKPVQKMQLKIIDKDLEESSSPKKVPVNESSVQHITPDFKKPGPFIIRSSKSKSVTPGTPHSCCSDQKSITGETTPEVIMRRNFKKKKSNLKRKLVEQFIDNEAEVTSDDDSQAEDYSNISDDDSFIDDEVPKQSNYSHYLKSIKSPGNTLGKFHIPVLPESRLRMNVCSQMDYFDQTYQNDSFCVDDVAVDQDSEYVPSILTQMEDQLRYKKKKKFKRSSQTDSSDDGSRSPNYPKKKHRKRIVCFSSDSD